MTWQFARWLVALGVIATCPLWLPAVVVLIVVTVRRQLTKEDE